MSSSKKKPRPIADILNYRKIHFFEVKSGICAPGPKGRLGAELGIDAIKNISIKKGSTIFLDHNSTPIIESSRQWKYAKEHKSDFIRDLPYHKDEVFKRETQRFARHIEYLKIVAKKISEALVPIKNNELLFFLSGDHSTAFGTIAAIKKQNQDKTIGVIWIDAHADLHSPYTTPSGNMHGMPVACALGLNEERHKTYFDDQKEFIEKTFQVSNIKRSAVDEDKIDENIALTYMAKLNEIMDKNIVASWDELCNSGGVNPMIAPENLVYIGLRDTEGEEDAYIKAYDVLEFRSEKRAKSKSMIGEYQIDEIVKATTARLSKCDIVYISFDIDSIDKKFIKGTGTPVEGGLSVSQAKKLLRELIEQLGSKLMAIELVEVNPLLDKENGTAKVAFDIIESLIDPGKKLRTISYSKKKNK